MSGILGYYNTQGIDNAYNLHNMSEKLAIRGRYKATQSWQNITLEQRQNTPIAQLATAKKANKQYTIAFSGKIFNQKEIAKKLQSHGHDISKLSNESIVLHAFLQWGKGSVIKLNGVFAFAIWDNTEKKLFLARDRAGVMPLFYYRFDKGIIFASTLKSLMASQIPSQIDNYGLKQLLLLGPSRVCGSGIIRGVKELKVGQCAEIVGTHVKLSTYWRPLAMPHLDDYATTVEKTRELINNAIVSQTTQDMGCFLSGGLDSSIITKVVADIFKQNNTNLQTFSVDYKENELFFEKNSFQSTADNQYIDLMSEYTNSHHKNYQLTTEELLDAISVSSEARDLPGMGDIDSSLLLFCNKVKQNVGCCLSGECADELFGGYPWYHKEQLLFRDNFPWQNATELRERLFNKDILGEHNQEFVHDEYRSIIENTDYLDNDSTIDKRIREMFMLNYYSFMQTLIERSDRMSAYCNLEVYLPFCDNHVIDYAYNMPWHFKAVKGREKGIIREAYKNILPQQIINRKKTPYPKTFNPNFAIKIMKKAQKLVHDKNSILSQLINKQTFLSLQENKISMQQPWFGQLMRVPQIFGYIIELDMFFKRFNVQIIG